MSELDDFRAEVSGLGTDTVVCSGDLQLKFVGSFGNVDLCVPAAARTGSGDESAEERIFNDGIGDVTNRGIGLAGAEDTDCDFVADGQLAVNPQE